MSPRRPPARRAGAVAAAAALALAACGSGPVGRPHSGNVTASTVNGVQQVTITTGPDLRFHPSTFTVHVGPVRVRLVNQPQNGAGPPHNLLVDGHPRDYIPLTQPGETGAVTFVTPQPGRYRFVCTIHLAQGQTGTMVVTR
jgi:plastocyanin